MKAWGKNFSALTLQNFGVLFADGPNCIRYSVFRRVVDYYSDNPTGTGGEDAFDMRKPLSRDKKKQHVRKNGEDFRVDPEDLYHV